ncbi:MAG: hypothetical protein QGG64_02865, partial [Candidatus Latescibacteria bacterium]|nr:hypothetical protein [Candidatus Latescibacterota bacterium]
WLILMKIAPDQPADLLAVPVGFLAILILSLTTSKTNPPKPLSRADGAPLPFADRLGIIKPGA